MVARRWYLSIGEDIGMRKMMDIYMEEKEGDKRDV
jgi:hypothetical protein